MEQTSKVCKKKYCIVKTALKCVLTSRFVTENKQKITLENIVR